MDFKIRSKKKEGTAPLYVRVQSRGVNWMINTTLQVDINNWNKSLINAKELKKYYSSAEGSYIQKKLHEIEGIIDVFTSKPFSNDDKDILTKQIKNIVTAELREKLERDQQRAKKIKSEVESLKTLQESSVLRFYRYFLDGITNGNILTKNNTRYKQTSLDAWKSFGTTLKEYVKDENVCFDDITESWKDGFSAFLSKRHAMVGTISKLSSRFQTLCREAQKYGFNHNIVTLRNWNTRGANPNKNECINNIYLDENELDALYEMSLKGEEEKVRDVFFLGTCTWQRYSDYSRINKNMIRKDGDVTYISLTQKKTGVHRSLPIIDERAIEILNKYKYNIPQIEHRRFNVLLKRIFKKLSETVESLNEIVETPATYKDISIHSTFDKLSKKKTLTPEERKYYRKLNKQLEDGYIPLMENGICYRKRWQLVCTHTARRSAITNSCNNPNLKDEDKLYMSGHTSTRMLRKYDRLRENERAMQVAERLKLH